MIDVTSIAVQAGVFRVSQRILSQESVAQQIADSIALYQQRMEAMFALEEALNHFTATYYGALQAPLAQLSTLKQQLRSLEQDMASKITAAPKSALKRARPNMAHTPKVSAKRPVNKTEPLFDARAIPHTPKRAQSLLKQRYHHVCRMAHPDAHVSEGMASRRKAHEWMQSANAAYVQKNAASLWRIQHEMEEVAAASLSPEAREVSLQERVAFVKRHAYDIGEWLMQLEESDEARMVKLAQEMAQLGTPMEEVVATQLEMETETIRRALAKAQIERMARLRGEMS